MSGGQGQCIGKLTRGRMNTKEPILRFTRITLQDSKDQRLELVESMRADLQVDR